MRILNEIGNECFYYVYCFQRWIVLVGCIGRRWFHQIGYFAPAKRAHYEFAKTNASQKESVVSRFHWASVHHTVMEHVSYPANVSSKMLVDGRAIPFTIPNLIYISELKTAMMTTICHRHQMVRWQQFFFIILNKSIWFLVLLFLSWLQRCQQC